MPRGTVMEQGTRPTFDDLLAEGVAHVARGATAPMRHRQRMGLHEFMAIVCGAWRETKAHWGHNG